MKHEINGKNYTLTQLKTKLAEVVKNNLNKELLGEDYDFAYWALLQRRSTLTYKPKIKALQDTSGKHMQYQLPDGSWDDFSYYKACKSSISENKNNLDDAFRWAVYSQTRTFRDEELLKPENKELLELKKNNSFDVHVDHVIPFHLLKSDFLEKEKQTPENIKIEKHKTLQTYILVDIALAKKWKEFHKKHAKLKLITAKDNLTKASQYDLPLWRYKQNLI